MNTSVLMMFLKRLEQNARVMISRVRMMRELMMKKMAIAVVLSLVMLSMTAAAMSVDEAYRAIPHRRTAFSAEQAKMNAKTKAYLDTMFGLADQALVLRVQALQWFQTAGRRGITYADYEPRVQSVLDQLNGMKPPNRLSRVHRLLIEAITEQQQYLKAWSQSYDTSPRFNARHKLVKRSHRKLLQAYEILMQTHPREGAYNKRAFYDHLCALDFL